MSKIIEIIRIFREVPEGTLPVVKVKTAVADNIDHTMILYLAQRSHCNTVPSSRV